MPIIMPDGRTLLTCTEAADLWIEIVGGIMSRSTYYRMFNNGKLEELGIATSTEGEKRTDLDSLLEYFGRYAEEVRSRARDAIAERAAEIERIKPRGAT